MKLNGGRGWDAMKSHNSPHPIGNVNPPADASARAMHGAPRADGRPSRDRAAISADRLNAAQPPTPGSPAKPGVAAKNPRDRSSANNLPKRSSGLAGQLDAGTPTASTQAQFQNSNANLVGQRQSPATGALQSNQRPQQEQPGFFQKVMKTLCCAW
jgi:casein kinase 1